MHASSFVREPACSSSAFSESFPLRFFSSSISPPRFLEHVSIHTLLVIASKYYWWWWWLISQQPTYLIHPLNKQTHTHTQIMAPIVEKSAAFTQPLVRSAKAAVVAAGPSVAKLANREVLSRRDLSVTSDSQKVTLGVIAAYIVAIALLWNLPFVRWSLWPFKVSHHHHHHPRGMRDEWMGLNPKLITCTDAGHRIP